MDIILHDEQKPVNSVNIDVTEIDRIIYYFRRLCIYFWGLFCRI